MSNNQTHIAEHDTSELGAPEDKVSRVHPMLVLKVQNVIAQQPDFGKLRERLVAIGDDEIVPNHVYNPVTNQLEACPDPFAELLVECGSVIDSSRRMLRTRGMWNNRCHLNISRLMVQKRPPIKSIGAGYVLSDGGLWAQHAWGVKPDGTILDTTYAQDENTTYFGVIFPKTGSIYFAIDTILHWPEEVDDKTMKRVEELLAK